MVYDVYVRALANIDARYVVIIHGHWLALMHGGVCMVEYDFQYRQ